MPLDFEKCLDEIINIEVPKESEEDPFIETDSNETNASNTKVGSKAVYRELNKFKCDICFKNRKPFAHKSKKSCKPKQDTTFKFECAKCGVSYGRKSHLTEHIESKHDNVRYDCTKCDYKATRKSHLRVHIALYHVNPILYCKECDVQGKRKDLYEHMRNQHWGGELYPSTIRKETGELFTNVNNATFSSNI